jgi:putative transcriptional regulator
MSDILDIRVKLCYTTNVKYIRQGETMANEKMKQSRLERQLSQAELARRVGVSRQTVNMIESGDYNPTLALCIRICRELGKTLDELFWEVEDHV